MPLFALLIGAILVVASIRGTQGSLFSALGDDVPAYVTWATAIIIIGSIGFIGPLKPISRGLLILILVVLVLRNYKTVVTGFTNATTAGANLNGTAKPGTVSIVPEN